MIEIYPLWGRELDDYTSSYDFEAALHRFSFNADSETALWLEAEESMLEICKLAGNGESRDLDAIMDHIHLPTLQSVLKLALSPHTIRHLARPPLIRGCLKLMSTVKQSGKPSPFSHEYGYLCFRILTIAINVCLLERSSTLDDAIDRMLLEPKAALLQVLSEHVSKVVIQAAGDGRHCDLILGWAGLEGQAPEEVLMLDSDVTILLDLLWTDRKDFLRALASTYSPGLSGVMLLLWRYCCLEGALHPDENQDRAKSLALPFCEVLWRYWLIAPTDQEHPLRIIDHHIGKGSGLWEVTIIDLEDCRLVLRAYLDRLVPNNKVLYAPLDFRTIPMHLGFAGSFVQHGAEDMLPLLFGSTISQTWDRLLGIPQLKDAYLNNTQDIFIEFTKLLEPLRHAPHAVILQFVDTLVKNDLLDLTARIMSLLKPSTTDAEINLNAYLFSIAETFFDIMSTVVPKELLRSTFDEVFQDWMKYRLYILWCREMPSASRQQTHHLDMCTRFWLKIAQFLQQNNNIEIVCRFPPSCNYARCPDPEGVGSQFACSHCVAVYCSARCQTADWVHNDWQLPHGDARRGPIKPYPPRGHNSDQVDRLIYI